MTTYEEQQGLYDSIATGIASADLQALANNGFALGPEIDFRATGVDGKPFMDIEVYLAQQDLSAQPNPAVNIWVLKRTDGTNYETYDTTAGPARPPDAILPVNATNAAHRLFAEEVKTGRDRGKLLLQNKTGAALTNDTNNTVKYLTWGFEIVG